MIEDLLTIYMENPGSRFRIMYLDAENTIPIQFEYLDIAKNQTVTRPLTLTDVVYMCCKSAIEDANRMVYTVRYPIGDYLGAFFTKVHVLSTLETTRIQFKGVTYDYYPVIDVERPHNKVATSFIETINMSNSRLAALGADYDGDTVKSVGLWSDEANAKAEELMYSKIYNIKAEGDSVYSVKIECLNGLYALTKRNDQ